ncbi:uncharacterized protein [Typha angustifolia]|uniref:uncharacterized protein n=1 Tax=Typha angustifolia TaxID=59011 RepID=UPI003C2C3BA7
MAARAPTLLLLIFFAYSFRPSTSIPAKYDGFVYKEAESLKDSILIEAFFDPLCPDSRDSWPPLKKLVEQFSPRVSLIVHPFPLPYHNNAFLSCRALHIANMLNASSTYPLLELFFKYQEKFYNAPTINMSRSAITEKMTKLAVMAVGNSLLTEFQSGFQDSKTDLAARVSFKYGCSRGVGGAPFFFVNGFLLPGGGSPLDYSTWTDIIKPLLEKNEERMEEMFLSL